MGTLTLANMEMALRASDEGDFLGGGDDDGAVEGEGLDDGELDVSGAGGEVEDEDVEFSPGDLVEELLGVAGGEGGRGR